jgi:hypothetical protein
MDSYLASYIFCYYQRFMTAKEKLANRQLTATAKVTQGRTDVAGQKRQETAACICETFCLHPEVLELARDGVDAFVLEDGPENHGRSLR